MKISAIYRWCFCASLLVAPWASAMSALEVQRALTNGTQLTLIDIRPVSVFKQGHIPNAINVPASLVPQKELPPLGTVVVYDDGLGTDAAATAAQALNEKPGINASVLNGGYAAWQSAQSATTASPGMANEELPVITYDKLKKTQNEDIVLVDLRDFSATTNAVPGIPRPARLAKADLSAEFPNARVTKSALQIPPGKRALAVESTTPPLLVLIDSGDGTAQQVAKTLKANGVKRFVILAGGDEMIRRQGQSGSDRIGSTMSARPGEFTGSTNSTK